MSLNLLESFNRWKNAFKEAKRIKNRLELSKLNGSTLLYERYHTLSDKLSFKDRLRLKEFNVFSQNGEDGLILYIFSQIGVSSRRFIEFGIGDGSQCNTLNLAKNFGWGGLLMESNEEFVQKARKLQRSLRGGGDSNNVVVNRAMVTKENINFLIRDNMEMLDIDLLSIDIDGMDYWVWEAIECVSPRLVIVEYNSTFGDEKSITVPYTPEFDGYKINSLGWYHGASLVALTKLGKKKGYELIGCDSFGVNAFFVRRDLIGGELQIQTPKEAFYSQPKRDKLMSNESQLKSISHLEIKQV